MSLKFEESQRQLLRLSASEEDRVIELQKISQESDVLLHVVDALWVSHLIQNLSRSAQRLEAAAGARVAVNLAMVAMHAISKPFVTTCSCHSSYRFVSLPYAFSALGGGSSSIKESIFLGKAKRPNEVIDIFHLMRVDCRICTQTLLHTSSTYE